MHLDAADLAILEVDGPELIEDETLRALFLTLIEKIREQQETIDGHEKELADAASEAETEAADAEERVKEVEKQLEEAQTKAMRIRSELDTARRALSLADDLSIDIETIGQ